MSEERIKQLEKLVERRDQETEAFRNQVAELEAELEATRKRGEAESTNLKLEVTAAATDSSRFKKEREAAVAGEDRMRVQLADAEEKIRDMEAKLARIEVRGADAAVQDDNLERIKKLKRRSRKLGEENEALLAEKNEVEGKLKTWKYKVEEAQKAQQEAVAQVKRMQEEVQSRERSLEYEDDMAALKLQLKRAKNLADEWRADIEKQNEKIRELGDANIELEKKLEAASEGDREVLKKLRRRLEEAELALDDEKATTEAVRKEKSALEVQVIDLEKAAIERAEAETMAAFEEPEAPAGPQVDESLLKQKEAELEVAEETLHSLEQELENLRAELESTQDGLASAQAKLNQADSAQLQQELNTFKGRVAQLETQLVAFQRQDSMPSKREKELEDEVAQLRAGGGGADAELIEQLEEKNRTLREQLRELLTHLE